MGIDTKILNKPGKLTDEEFKEIEKSAPVIGETVLKSLDEYKDEPLLRKFRRRYAVGITSVMAGNGYPDGLSGDEIPISAQIVCRLPTFSTP